MSSLVQVFYLSWDNLSWSQDWDLPWLGSDIHHGCLLHGFESRCCQWTAKWFGWTGVRKQSSSIQLSLYEKSNLNRTHKLQAPSSLNALVSVFEVLVRTFRNASTAMINGLIGEQIGNLRDWNPFRVGCSVQLASDGHEWNLRLALESNERVATWLLIYLVKFLVSLMF